MNFRWRSVDLERPSHRSRRAAVALVEHLERRCVLAVPVLSPIGLNIAATQNVEFSGAVATFVGINPFTPASGYTATIDWGDQGPTSPGTVVSSGLDSFTINGQHTYATAGSFPTTITIKGVSGNFSLPPAKGTADVSPQPVPVAPITVSPVKLSATQKQAIPANTAVAYFIDTDPGFTATDFSANVAWGDGVISPGTITAEGGGVYAVTSGRDPGYATPGTFTFNVGVTNNVNHVSASGTGTAVVASPTFNATGTTFSATPGGPVDNVTVATLSDSDPNANTGNITALINWGGGQTTLGTVSLTAPGSYTVTGSFTYPISTPGGPSPVTVTFAGPDGLSATANSTALVANTATGVTFSGGLAPTSTRNPALGIANTNRPIFTGTAPPFAIVELFAQHSGIPATLPLGQAIASASGSWSLLTGPLGDGAYVVTARVVPSGGYPSNPLPLTSNNGQVIIGPAIQLRFMHPGKGAGPAQHPAQRSHHHAHHRSRPGRA